MNSKLLIVLGLGLVAVAGMFLLLGAGNRGYEEYVGTWHGTCAGQWQFAAMDVTSETGASMGSGLLEETFEYVLTLSVTQTRVGKPRVNVEIGQQGSEPLESMMPATVRRHEGLLTVTFERHVEPFEGADIHTTLELYLSLEDDALVGTGLYVADLILPDVEAFEIEGETFPNERMTIHWPEIVLDKREASG